MPNETETQKPDQQQPADQFDPSNYSDGVARIRERFSAKMKEVDSAVNQPTPIPGKERKDEKPPDQKVDEKKEAPPEKPVESKEAITDEPPATMSPKAAESWKSFRKSANEQIAKAKTEAQNAIAERDRKIQELESRLKTPAVDPQKYADLEKSNKELDEQLRIAAIERHPKFKAYYDNRMTQAVELAKKVVGAEKAPIIEKLLAMPDSEYRSEKLEELAAELSPLRQGELATAITEHRRIQSERESELAKWQDNGKRVQEFEQQQQHESMSKKKQAIEKIATQAMDFAKSLESFQSKDGDEAHNAEVSGREKLIKAFFSGSLKEDVLETLPVLAAHGLYLMDKRIPTLEAEIAKRDKIIESYTQQQPRNPNNGKEAEVAQPTRFMDRWNSQTKS